MIGALATKKSIVRTENSRDASRCRARCGLLGAGLWKMTQIPSNEDACTIAALWMRVGANIDCDEHSSSPPALDRHSITKEIRHDVA
jgi:hypothetical protein